MSIRFAATGMQSVFRGMTGFTGLLLVAAFMLLALFCADTATAADGATVDAAGPRGAAVASQPMAGGALPPAQAVMSFMPPPMPGFAPPRIMEPVAMAACRQCREGCFRDYGGPCADENCVRALPLCMRNCWHALCR